MMGHHRDAKEQLRDEFKKRIKQYVIDLIHFIDSLPKTNVSHVVGKQLLRSGTSVGANYFEARAASSRNDFINFFAYSLKSANESKFWLEILRDAGKADYQKSDALLKEVSEIAKIFASSILTLKRKKTAR